LVNVPSVPTFPRLPPHSQELWIDKSSNSL
jgi:hypothetical protein